MDERSPAWQFNRTIALETADERQKPERRDAAANRRLLLQTAETLFAAHGVAHVSMADIAQAAGVGKGTLYRRFANKAELCLSLVDAQMAEFQNRLLGELRRMSGAGVPCMAQLDLFLDALVHFTERHAPLLCEASRAGLMQAETRAELPHFWQYMTVSGLLHAALKAGEVAETLDIGYLADALLAPLSADIYQFQRQVRGFSPERISAGLRLLAAGLRL